MADVMTSSTGGPVSGRLEAVFGMTCGVCGEKHWPWTYARKLIRHWAGGRWFNPYEYREYQYTHEGPHGHSWSDVKRVNTGAGFGGD